jgi:hypothetical protein
MYSKILYAKGDYIIRSTNNCFRVNSEDLTPSVVKHIFNKTDYNCCMEEVYKSCAEHSDCTADMKPDSSIMILVENYSKDNNLILIDKIDKTSTIANSELVTIDNISYNVFFISYNINRLKRHCPKFKKVKVFTFYVSNRDTPCVNIDFNTFRKYRSLENNSVNQIIYPDITQTKWDSYKMVYPSNTSTFDNGYIFISNAIKNHKVKKSMQDIDKNNIITAISKKVNQQQHSNRTDCRLYFS